MMFETSQLVQGSDYIYKGEQLKYSHRTETGKTSRSSRFVFKNQQGKQVSLTATAVQQHLWQEIPTFDLTQFESFRGE